MSAPVAFEKTPPSSAEAAAAPLAERAAKLGVSTAALELTLASEVIDLHIDTFIPPRLFGYDLEKHHGKGLLRGHFFGHLDFPRIAEGGLTGAMWSVTTNPIRSAKGRWEIFQKNVRALRAAVEATSGRLRLARNHHEFVAARAAGAHVVLLSIQGGSALEAAPASVASIADDAVVRVTLVHLTNSVYGSTSSPLAMWRKKRGLSEEGRELVRALNARRVFVDLAHINEEGFWDAVAVHDRSQPLIATHTGVSGVKPHWRNLDDRQVRAIADTGGVIGIIFAQNYLRARGSPEDGRVVVDHMEHVVRTAGEDFVAIGSDYDGAITPPTDLRDGLGYPRLVQHMLDRGWSETRIVKILGGNFLRSFAALRP